MSLTSALRIVRVSALYDLIVTVGFAFPFSAPLVFAGVAALQTSLGVGGSLPDAGDASTVMFANLMGGLVTVWSLFRIVRPSLFAGAADTLGRAFFSMGMIAALLAGASPVIWIMLVPELAWGVVQGWAVFVRFPRRGQELGFTLAELSAFVELSARARSGVASADEVAQAAVSKVVEIGDRIAALERTRTAITGMIDAQCVDTDAPCPIVQALGADPAPLPSRTG